jgi:putative pre-16S rRNA nuclease
VLAVPVETIARNDTTLSRIVQLTREHAVVEVVIGLPLSLSGAAGAAADKAAAFAADLAALLTSEQLAVSVRLVDERFTTVSAERVMRAHTRKRDRQRSVIDQAAAVVLLQHALEVEQSTGQPPGQEVGQGR